MGLAGEFAMGLAVGFTLELAVDISVGLAVDISMGVAVACRGGCRRGVAMVRAMVLSWTPMASPTARAMGKTIARAVAAP